MKNIKAENMQSTKGNDVPNQFLLFTEEGTYFQSYNTIIAFKPFQGKIKLDPSYDYSKTTGKYRNQFLGEDKKETDRKIKAGIYEVVNLNN